MSAYRGTGFRAMAIGIVVAAGFWIAKHPDVADKGLGAGAATNGSDEELICVRRLAWSFAGVLPS